jgi:hypothetical protein
MKPTSATEQKDPKRRDGALPAELRDLEKLVLAFAEEFSFARDEVERLKKKTAGVIAAWRQREAGYRAGHHKSRAYLNGLTKGGIERWIAASDDEDLKSHFRRVWRDDAPAPDASTKQTSLNPATVEAQGTTPTPASVV